MRMTTIGRLLGCVTALAAFAFASGAVAGTIAQWTFETSVPAATNSATIGPIAPEVGAGAASGVHASADTDYSNPVGNGSGESLSSNTWAIGDYYQFQVSTTGLANIGLAWDQTRSSTGPEMFQVQWSTDGSAFTDFGSDYAVPVITWSSTTPDATGTTSFFLDMSSITSLNNQADIYLRLTATSDPSAAAGSNRVDNVSVLDAVPEPTTFVLLAMAGVALVGCGRRMVG